MDFGYVNDPSTLFCGLVDTVAREIYVFDEMYEKGMSNEDIKERVSEMGYSKERIKADSAEPKSIAYLRKAGLTRIRAAKKDLTHFVPEFRLSRTIKLLFILGVLISLQKLVITHGIKISSTMR